MKSAKYLLYSLFERKRDDNNKYINLLQRILFPLYRFIWVKTKDRRVLDYYYWGRENSVIHASGTFSQTEDVWRIRFSVFYEKLASLIDSLTSSSKQPIKIVEIGCGMGQWAKRLGLSQINCRYIGYDVNQKTIFLANQHFSQDSNISFLQSDIRDVEFKEVDLIISCQFLFFIDPESIMLILDRIQVGAHIIIGEPINHDHIDYVIDANHADIATSSVILEKTQGSTGFSHPYRWMLNKGGFKVLDSGIISAGKVFIIAKKVA